VTELMVDATMRYSYMDFSELKIVTEPVFENAYFSFFFRFQKNVTFYVFLN